MSSNHGEIQLLNTYVRHKQLIGNTSSSSNTINSSTLSTKNIKLPVGRWPIHIMKRSSIHRYLYKSGSSFQSEGEYNFYKFDFGLADTIIIDNCCNIWYVVGSGKSINIDYGETIYESYKFEIYGTESIVPLHKDMIDCIKSNMVQFESYTKTINVASKESISITYGYNSNDTKISKMYCTHIISTLDTIKSLSSKQITNQMPDNKEIQLLNATIVDLKEKESGYLKEIQTLNTAFETSKPDPEISELKQQIRKLKDELTHYIVNEAT